jgi:ankyrin repeat protein
MQLKVYFLCFFLQLSSFSIAGDLEYNLFEAINRSDFEYAKELIGEGADVNQKQEPFKQTPIIVAPLRGMNFVKLLMKNGADINVRDQDNNTALINASLYGEVAIVKHLIAHKADIHVINNDGLNAYDAALLADNKEIIAILKALGARKNQSL